jgi:hypothetical protein
MPPAHIQLTQPSHHTQRTIRLGSKHTLRCVMSAGSHTTCYSSFAATLMADIHTHPASATDPRSNTDLFVGRQAAYAPSMSPTSRTPARLQWLMPSAHPGLLLLLVQAVAWAAAARAAAARAAGVLGRGTAPGMSDMLRVSRSGLSRHMGLLENCMPLQHTTHGRP